MKRKFMIIALLVALFVGVQSAEAQVRKWEAEIGVGGITPTSKLNFDKNTLGWNVQAEVRRNFRTLPIDLGLRVDGNVFSRKYEKLEDLTKTQFSSINALAVADLNLFRKSKVQLFVGCGLGYGWLSVEPIILKDVKEDFESIAGAIDTYKEAKETSVFTFMPRVGVELFHHVRATLYYKVHANSKEEMKEMVKGQGHFGLSLGFVIGGGLKK